MNKIKKISIIVPAYNEENILQQEITALVFSVKEKLKNIRYEILLVENGSTDNTRAIAESLSVASPEIKVISLPEGNYGKALKHGLLKSSGDALVVFNVDFWDADALLNALVLLDNDVDVVVCSKNMPGSKDLRSPFRRILTKIFNHVVLNFIFGYPGTDTHGIKMFHREKIMPIIAACQTDHDLVDTEIILRAHQSGLRIHEIPITCEEKRASNYGIIRHMPRIVKNTARLYFLLHQ